MFDEKIRLYNDITNNLSKNKYAYVLVSVLNHDILPHIDILSARYIKYEEDSDEVEISLDKFGSCLLRVQPQHEIYIDDEDDDRFYVIIDRENESVVTIVIEK